MNIYWILVIVFIALAAIFTFSIAFSNENKHANASYYTGTKNKLLTLASAYVILSVIVVAIIYLLHFYINR